MLLTSMPHLVVFWWIMIALNRLLLICAPDWGKVLMYLALDFLEGMIASVWLALMSVSNVL